MTQPVAAVTGATGFLGHHIAKALSKKGWRLRLLVRRMPEPELGASTTELVPGGLEDSGALEALVDSADAIVHVAGAIKAASQAAFMRVNAEGTARLLSARAAKASEARVVMVSSLAARTPGLSHYAASKAAGETYLRAAPGPWSILRPCAIYGPGDRETLSVFKLACLPMQPVLNGPDARVCLIEVSDVASAIVAAVEGHGDQRTLELSDHKQDGYSWHEIVATACAAMGTRPRPIRLPAGLIRSAGRLGDMGVALTGSAQMLTSQKVREILHIDWSSSAAAQLPSDCWAPSQDLSKGFHSAVKWYREAGWLPPVSQENPN
ncbi:MAG: SDR family NAD(P)-dependent oxidoreductase [Pseudomonadota bacterium]